MVVTFVLAVWFIPSFLLALSGNKAALSGDLPTAGRLWMFNFLAIAMELTDLRKPGGRQIAALYQKFASRTAKAVYVVFNAVSLTIFCVWQTLG
ncbi:MAG: hypothetical protein KAF27_12340 [Porphyrobacter sp.]|nr:hypothetical protein [Porphyrobacter sp.]